MTILVIQTAFLGDVVLTTPLLDILASAGHAVDVVATPAGAQALQGHRSIRSVIIYDKKGKERGVLPAARLAGRLRSMRYDVAILPHRSLRSAMLAFLAHIPRRIGFERSSASWALTQTVHYRSEAHEIDRNLDLARAMGVTPPSNVAPSLTISSGDNEVVRALLASTGFGGRPFVAVAPGSAWTTKRWPEGRFIDLCRRLVQRGAPVALVGGKEDEVLCERIRIATGNRGVMSAAGRLSVLQSAALIGSSAVLVTNDSAPLHLASAVGTPIVSIFGATSPAFGFGPRGPRDVVIEIHGLSCRPCAIHGGDRCPIGTFDCMHRIEVERVESAVLLAAGLDR
jgi:heptosyltransferase-2